MIVHTNLHTCKIQQHAINKINFFVIPMLNLFYYQGKFWIRALFMLNFIRKIILDAE